MDIHIHIKSGFGTTPARTLDVKEPMGQARCEGRRVCYIILMDGGTSWYPARLEEYLNLWFADYEKARKARDKEGGYLLPYKKHFFVCPPGAIRSIGLDPEDPDWERVGWDCARPRDEEAYRRLCEKRDQFEAARSR